MRNKKVLNSTLGLVMEDKGELKVNDCLGSSNHKLIMFINTYKKPKQALLCLLKA